MQTRRVGTFLAALALVAVLPGAAPGQFAVTRLAKAINRSRKISTRAKDDPA